MTGIDVTLLRQAGLSERLIEETIRRARREAEETFKMEILDTQPVQTFKNWLAKQEMPVKMTFTLPQAGSKVEARVSFPTGEGSTGGGKKQAIVVTTKQGGQETYPSYAEACRQLGLGDPSELNRSGKQMLDGAGIQYAVTDAETDEEDATK